MTANAFLEDVKKSKEAGMDEHLSKPVDIAALEQTVKRFRVTPLPPKIIVESHGFADDRHPRPSRAVHLRPSSFFVREQS